MMKGVVVVNKSENEDKLDCFAWISKVKCNALNKKECKNCSFYKTKTDVLGYEKYIEKDLLFVNEKKKIIEIGDYDEKECKKRESI